MPRFIEKCDKKEIYVRKNYLLHSKTWNIRWYMEILWTCWANDSLFPIKFPSCVSTQTFLCSRNERTNDYLFFISFVKRRAIRNDVNLDRILRWYSHEMETEEKSIVVDPRLFLLVEYIGLILADGHPVCIQLNG